MTRLLQKFTGNSNMSDMTVKVLTYLDLKISLD